MANPTPIDELTIEIDAKANDANNAIDSLCKKIDILTTSISKVDVGKLNSLGNGIKRLGDSLQTMKSVDARSISSVVNKINSLSAIDTSKFATVSANLHQMANGIQSLGTVSANVASVGELASNISKLGNKSVQTAVANIPQLATALNGLMTTLSKAPRVSQNVIQMTNALANLTAQGSKVGSASNSIVKGLNRASASAERSKKSFKGLASAFGTFYANCFMVIRGVKSLWSSIETSMDYLETLNYFDSAFEQVAESADLSSWKNLGYASAEEYYSSFSSRAKELTSKMTGFTISESGTLESSGISSLGIDPEKLMNYQAMFGQMSSSMGVASETALELSNVLTMIGADLASVKNMDFDKVWTDMASGLAGMSRTLDKYGANIRNVNLQQKITELGINANITALNQNDKALLRTIILLDSTKYAWGDLAETLELPANQLRLLKSNFQNLARSIGNLFLPVLQKVLPYLNGVVVALQRLVSWAGSLMGLDLSKITSSIGGSSNDIGDFVDGVDDASNSLESAAENAKKLKNVTLGIDELNINSPNKESGSTSASTGMGTSGLLDEAFFDIVNEYKETWNQAFEEMQKRAENFADKIEKALEPVKKIFQDFAVGDFFQAGKDVSNLVVSITDFFARAIDSVDWEDIGNKIGDFLAGIEWLDVFRSAGNLMWQGLKAAFELAIGVFKSAPLETALISLATMPKLLKSITSSKTVTGFKKLAKAIGLVVSGLAGNKDSAKLLITQYPKLGKAVDVVSDSFQRLMFGVHYGDWSGGINLAIKNIRDNLTGLQKGAITAIAGFAEFRIVSTSFEDVARGSENVVAAIAKIAGAVGIAATAMYTALGPAGIAITAVTGLVAAIKGISDAEKRLVEENEIEKYGDALTNVVAGINEASDAIKERAEASLEYVQTAGLAETQMASDLANEYFTLSEKEKLTNEEKEQMKTITSQLIDLLPELSEFYNEETGLLDTTRESVDKLINSRLREIQLSAVEEQLKEAYSDQAEQLKTLNNAIETANTAQEEMNELKKEQQELSKKQDLLEEYYRLSDEIIGCSGDTTELLKKQDKLWKELTDEGKKPLPTFEELGTKLNTAETEISKFEIKYEEVLSSLSNAKTAYESVGNNITELTKMLTSGMYEAAGYAVEGYTEGLNEGEAAVERANELLMGSGVNSAEGELEEQSPSKVYKKIGKYTVEGYNLGITENQKSTISTIQKFVKSATDSFNGIVSPMYNLGVNVIEGLYNGISSTEETLYKKVEKVAKAIASTIKNALGIHSPSRVMIGLGKYTIEGFRDGMESLYEPTIKSLKAFSYKVEIAPVPKLPNYTSYTPKTLTGFECGNSTPESSNTGNSETLLREQNELLRAILEKNISVSIGDRQIVESYNRGRARMGYSFT